MPEDVTMKQVPLLVDRCSCAVAGVAQSAPPQRAAQKSEHEESAGFLMARSRRLER
ncbi:MAG: hypothetical protein HC805_06720 [Alkalinema sp. RL_2_19]|nr:hypothetical protein [Alkalinema sp. RL_2_19]